MTVNVASLMSGLSEQRRAFHSEADFQLAFAWQIQRQHGGAQVRLETRPTPGQHLDVLVREGDAEMAIVLKYLTPAWDGLDKGERGRRGEFRYLALELTSDAIATNIESS